MEEPPGSFFFFVVGGGGWRGLRGWGGGGGGEGVLRIQDLGFRVPLFGVFFSSSWFQASGFGLRA